MPLLVTEADVAALVGIDDGLRAVEESLLAQAAGRVDNRPRYRIPLEVGALAVMAARDADRGLAGAKVYTASAGRRAAVIALFDTASGDLVALVEADRLGMLRTGAATGVAARHLARPGARTLGVIGCGRQAETQVAAVRAVLPQVEHVSVFCRDPDARAAFAERVGADAVGSHAEAADQDVVVTITTSADPVLRGDWLRPGALVCAAGANRPEARELDNRVLERAAFVCCDSRDDARIESGDLIDPVAQGILDWLEVHELADVVSGAVVGRQADDDVVVFKSNGLAAWDVALAGLVVDRYVARRPGPDR